jgi:hypothetical protein
MSHTLRQRAAGLARSLGYLRLVPAARRSFRPQLLPLEDRTLPGTMTVVNLHDRGAGRIKR